MKLQYSYRWLLAAVLVIPASAQTRLSLEKAAARKPSDYSPALEGQPVIVAGQVMSRPVTMPNNEVLLSIRDRDGYGLLLTGGPGKFDGLIPGDWLEVDGVIVKRHGMPALQANQMKRTASEPAPPPRSVTLNDLNGFRYQGLVVTTEGRVASIGQNQGGDLIAITDGRNYINVFLYRAKDLPQDWLEDVQVGDRIRVRGLASQFCNSPPYNHFFELILPDPSGLSEVREGGNIPPWVWLSGVGGVVLILALWWVRENRMARQRRTMRTLNTLSEQIVGASSPAEIVAKLQGTLPEVFGEAKVRMYLYQRRTKTLERVVSASDPSLLAFPVDDPPDAVTTGAAACCRNRALLNIADTRRSPLLKGADPSDLPRSILFVPMFTQNALLGVLEMARSEGVQTFSVEEQAAVQHLANQVATALKLQEQQTMREQLFRTEKLAATGQLISGVASELRAPLEAILEEARCAAQSPDPQAHLKSLTAAARRAAAIVSRLVSYARTDAAALCPVDLNEVLRGLAAFRAPEWMDREIEFVDHLTPDPLPVEGVQAQLEQVFLNLLVHAEQSAAESGNEGPRMLTATSGAIARRALVTITYPAKAGAEEDPLAEGALGLGVARGIVQSHGGELRYQARGAQGVFEVELPLARLEAADKGPGSGSFRKAKRALTILVVEPEAGLQKQVVAALSQRGHRVVPTGAPEEGMDLAGRMRFDLIVCPVLLQGRNSLDFLHAVRDQAAAFVVVADRYDTELAASLARRECSLLVRPWSDEELDRVLEQVEQRAEVAGARGSR
jgi:signal transduction histidine kinase